MSKKTDEKIIAMGAAKDAAQANLDRATRRLHEYLDEIGEAAAERQCNALLEALTGPAPSVH